MMSISQDLLYAILSMDAYNRGYKPGIAGLGGEGSVVGNATVKKDATQLLNPGEAQANDFYAVAYTDASHGNIIAYRGTDTFDDEVLAVDYPIAFNADFDEEEIHLASRFYRAVAGSASPGTWTLTGHSLGGGLAGFTGGVYDQEAVGFASIGFFPALLNFQKLVDRYQEVKDDPLLSTVDITDLPGMGLFFTVPLAEKQLAAMGIHPSDLPPLSAHAGNTYQGYHAEGEGAGISRIQLGVTPSTALLEAHLPDMGGTVGIADAHSASFTAILQYLKDEHRLKGEEALEFLPLIDPLFNALFDHDVADDAGFKKTGVSDIEVVMRDAIAYSAIDEGTMVFGNTGIRALFEDANEVGKLMDEGKAPMGYTSALKLERALAKSIVQFAGQMALGKVEYQLYSDVEPEQGFLRQDASGRLLQADLTKELWTLNDAGGENADREVEVLGIHSMLQDFLAGGSFADRAGPIVLAGMEHLYGDKTISDARVINRIDFVLGADPVDVEITDLETGTDTSDPKTAGLVVALDDTDDRLRGNADNNILLGKGGQDQLYGGAGKDLLIGGAGDDTLYGGAGEDWLHGGDKVATGGDFGEDTVDYSEGNKPGMPTPGAITLTFDLSQGVELEGNKSLVVTNDGYGTKDHLFAIETIKGTEKDDTVEVKGGDQVFKASSYALSTAKLEVDGQGGTDTLDFTNYTGQVYTKQADGGIKVGDVTFKGFETIKDQDSSGKIGGGTEVIDVGGVNIGAEGIEAITEIMKVLFDNHYYPEGTKEVFGNGGNDHLVIGPDGRRVEGNGGNDLLVGVNATYVPASEPGVLPPTPEERLTLDGGADNDWVFARNGIGAITVGGPGRDFLFNNSYKGQMYGDSLDGTGGGDTDVFWWSRDSFIMDAGKNDILQMYGVPLSGGSNSLFGTVANFGDVVIDRALPFVKYGATDGGQLLISTRWARGPMVVQDYEYGGFQETSLGIPEPGDLGMVFRIYGGDDLEIPLLFAAFGHLATYVEGMWTFAKGLRWKPHDDPLVLDLDGDGIETSTPDQGGVHFDLDNDFFSELTGWVEADDGFLVWDQDGNRQIDDSSELFGGPGRSGFAELRELDDNQDGLIDAQDARFRELEVWRDLNQDGRTDQGELFTLAELDITSLGAVGTEINHTTPNGNLLREQATYTRGDGSTGNIYEAIFQNDQIDTQFRGERGLAEWEGSAHTERIAA